MDFGSKYVYKYEHSSDESVSDEEDEATPPMLALARYCEHREILGTHTRLSISDREGEQRRCHLHLHQQRPRHFCANRNEQLPRPAYKNERNAYEKQTPTC